MGDDWRVWFVYGLMWVAVLTIAGGVACQVISLHNINGVVS